MGIRISVWWARYIFFFVWAAMVRRWFFFLSTLLLLLCSIFVRVSFGLCCMFHNAGVSLVLFVSLVRFLVSLIASRYSMPMQNNTHSRGQTYMYIKFRVINKRTNERTYVRTHHSIHKWIWIIKKSARTEYIFFQYTHAKNEQTFLLFRHRQLFGCMGKTLVDIFFHFYPLIQLWVVGVCPTTIALASKKYSSRLSIQTQFFNSTN